MSLNPEALDILNELTERSNSVFHQYEPQAGQTEFHRSLAYIRLLFGGNQSGKSRGAAQEAAYWFTHEHPHRPIPDRPCVIWIISTEYRTIYAGVYRHLMNIIPSWHIDRFGPKIQGTEIHSFIKSIRGDEIHFISAKGASEARQKFQAAALDLVVIDEEIEDYIWDELQARMISTGGCFVIAATLVESYDWIVTLEKRGEQGDADVFLARLLTHNNKYADDRQVKRLMNMWDTDTQHVRIYGKSARASGLIYRNFSKAHLIDPFPIPFEWPRWHAYDPGFRIAAGLWVTVTPKGQIIIYREVYEQNAELPDLMNQFKFLERDEIIDRKIIDDKHGSRLITGDVGVLEQCAMYYHRYYTPAQKQVHAGIEECRKALKLDDIEGDYFYQVDHTLLQLPKRNRILIFNNLENFKNEISQYRYKTIRDHKDRNEPVDQPVKRRDHLMDCWRYIMMARPEYFERPNYQPTVDIDDLPPPKTLEDKHNRWLARKEQQEPMDYLDGCW